MLRAVELDDELPLDADEVDDIGADRRLTAELQALQAAVPEQAPEDPLGLCHGGAEGASSFHSASGSHLAHRIFPHPPSGTFSREREKGARSDG